MIMAFAWVLVTVSGNGSGQNIVYSPILYDMESCQFLQKNLPRTEKIDSKCIQIKVAK